MNSQVKANWIAYQIRESQLAPVDGQAVLDAVYLDAGRDSLIAEQMLDELASNQEARESFARSIIRVGERVIVVDSGTGHSDATLCLAVSIAFALGVFFALLTFEI